MQMVPFSFRAIEELELGPKWAALFEERWPHYQEWFLREGEAARPSYATSARMLREYMPELMTAYERVVELAGGGDVAARMLSLYRPPPYLAACSQGVWSREGGPVLVRNYDYAPSRMEGIVWSTRLTERRVIGMSDCLWGSLDGMNDAGLAGVAHVRRSPCARRRVRDPTRRPLPARDVRRRRVGPAVARAASLRPCAQPDRGRPLGGGADRVPVARPRAHLPGRPGGDEPSGNVEWPEQARATRTIERERCILDLLARPATTAASFEDAFLRSPLFSTAYDSGFGTLYTAAYRPAEGIVDYRWPSFSWRLGFDAFVEAEHTEALAEGSVA